MKNTRVSAPGKIVLAGEYAVALIGSPAIAAAIDLRGWGTYTDPGDGADPTYTPEVACGLRLAVARGGLPGQLSLDVTAMHGPAGQKLGVGSSATKAVLSVASPLLHAGQPLTADSWSLALQAHRAVAPHGSGIDVAAVWHGGFVRLDAGSVGRPRVESLPKVNNVYFIVLGSTRAASTAALLVQVRALGDAAVPILRDIADAAHHVSRAWDSGDGAGVIEGLGAHGPCFGALGERLGAPLLPTAWERLRTLAGVHGGAIKPSGAGGGDVMVAAFPGQEEAAAFSAAIDPEVHDLQVLSAALGAPGVREEA